MIKQESSSLDPPSEVVVEAPDPTKYSKSDKPCYYVTKNGAGSACVCRTVNYLGLCKDHYPVVKRQEAKVKASGPSTPKISTLPTSLPSETKTKNFPIFNTFDKEMSSSSDESDSDIESKYLNKYYRKYEEKPKAKQTKKSSKSSPSKSSPKSTKYDPFGDQKSGSELENSESESEQDVYDTEGQSDSDSQQYTSGAPQTAKDVKFALLSSMGFEVYLYFIAMIEKSLNLPGLHDDISNSAHIKIIFPELLRDLFEIFGWDPDKFGNIIMFAGANIIAFSKASMRRIETYNQPPGLHY